MSLFGPLDYFKTQRILIAAKYSDSVIDLKDKIPDEAVVPRNAVPVYTEENLTLFDTNAIAYHLGNDQLRGLANKTSVTQWCNFADIQLLPSVGTLVYPCLGITQLNKTDQEKAKVIVQEYLLFINNFLLKRTYLVGDQISLADITVFSVLKMLYENVYDEAARRPFVNLNRWIMAIANEDNVRSVVGDFHLCEVTAHFDAKKYALLHPKKSQNIVKNVDKTSAKSDKKAGDKKTIKTKDVEGEDGDEPLLPIEKEVDPYKVLPSGEFNMEEWKRVYSNNDIESVALKYFWDHFDAENYSIWTCEYLFPEELGLIFMTCNLVSGMFQRLEKLRKYAFGSMIVLGQDKNNTIKGLWVWRGQNLAFPMSPDCSIDYESYKWEKLCPTSANTKEIVKKYFLHAGDFGEKAFNQGKIFK